MGELIRKMGEISLGDASFDVELNEAYVKGGEPCVHIQDPNFRYQMSVSEFYRAAMAVKKARTSMAEAKQAFLDDVKPAESRYIPAGAEAEAEVGRVAAILSAAQIDYRYIGGLEKCLTFLAAPSSAKKVGEAFKQNGMKECQHPLGETAGYTFLYQMEPFRLFRKGSYYVEIFFQIPCLSLTKKMWIPLDKAVQKRAFEEAETRADGVRELSEDVRVILALSWAMLKRRGFLDCEIEYIKAHSAVFDDEEFREMLRKVFFRYTDRLIEHIRQNAFDRLVAEYYSNTDY